ncbi:aminotransferase class V-fold PLP-dependent enzyme [Streptomyces subrutilus]|uniref:aminotransferase class V-fold PLP-dependent enzyme n=1 Tax=Streptomyces subrutilus TaxID=36818 RepID=UPI0034133BF3
MNTPTHHARHTAHLNTAYAGRMPRAVRAVLAGRTAHDDRHTAPAPPGRPAPRETALHELLGRLLGVAADDTVLATGAAQVFDAYTARLDLRPGDRIWTTPHEGVAHLTALHALRDRTRARLETVPLRTDGDLDLDWMREHLDDDVALVSVVHVSAACGTLNPAEDIGRLLAPHRARYLLDASHSAGQLPLDAARIGCDLLTADGFRFLRGPQDTGFAYLRPGRRDTHPQAPAPTPAAAAALACALAHHTPAPAAPDLLPRLRAALRQIPGTELLPAGTAQAGILAFRHPQVPAALLRRRLARLGVAVAKTVAQETPLHPAGRGGATAVRVSVTADTSPRDLDRLTHALEQILREEHHTTTHTAAVHPPRQTAAPVRAAAGHSTPRPAHTTPPPRRGHLTLHRTP